MARKRPQADSQAEGQQGPQATQEIAQVTEGQAKAEAPARDEAQGKAEEQERGNVSALPSAAGQLPAGDPLACAKEVRGKVYGRLLKDGRWKSLGLDQLRDDMFRECRSRGMERESAMSWVYSELDRLYPPIEGKSVTDDAFEIAKSGNGSDLAKSPPSADSGRVQGLGDLPPTWPDLPANASLAAEIGWVQANRLYVVEELDRGGTRVHLDRAHEPAPSRAAIGWLETSIRSYAKYVEVAAKATGAGQDEQAQERQERMDLDDVRSLLAEMQ